MNRLCLILFLIGYLAACAPTVPGSSSSNPRDLSRLSVLTVFPGDTWYLTKTFDFRELDFQKDDFATSLTTDPRVGKRYISNANSRLEITEADLPESWKLTLWNARAVKRIVEMTNNLIYYDYTIDTNFALRVPEGAEPGSYRINATVQADNGTTQTVKFTATVVPERSE